MIDTMQAAEWIAGGRAALELLRSAWTLLPVGHEKHAIAATLDEAEFALEASHALLAKDLGFRLCQCCFPPKPMLWDNCRRAFMCQNPDCGWIGSGKEALSVVRPGPAWAWSRRRINCRGASSPSRGYRFSGV